MIRPEQAPEPHPLTKMSLISKEAHGPLFVKMLLLKPLNPLRGRDRGLQLFPVNQEFPVGTSHKLAPIMSLPFVHTALCTHRPSLLPIERFSEVLGL